MTPYQRRIQEVVVPMLRPYASRIALFGSVARGDIGAGSDIDILIALKPPGNRPTLGLRFFELEQEMSRKMGRSVEVVTERALSPFVHRNMAEEIVLLYEDKPNEG